MTQYYELTDQEASPVTLADVKCALKITNNGQDSLLLRYIAAATKYGENYTGRAFRVQTWQLFLDNFSNRIKINRSPVSSIVSVEYLKDLTPVTIPADTYYLKTLQQCSELLVAPQKEWPTDGDLIEHSIIITFQTAIYKKQEDLIKEAITRHVSYLYFNRGDCDDCNANTMRDSGAKSGANAMYNQFRISRV